MEKIFTNYDIMNIIKNIQSEVFTNKEAEFYLPFAWKLHKNIKVLMDINTTLTEQMQKLEAQYTDDEHSTVSEEDSTIRMVKPEYMEEYTQKKIELLSCPNTIKVEMANIDEVGVEKINPATLQTLAFMINDEDTTATE